MGKALDVDEQILPHIGNDFLTRLLQNHGLEIRARHRDKKDCRIARYPQKQGIQREFSNDELLNFADDQRRNDIVRDRKQHQKPNNDKLAVKRLCVIHQTLHDFTVFHVPLKAGFFFSIFHYKRGHNQQGGNHADDRADPENRIIIVHFYSSPASSSSFCRSTILRYAVQVRYRSSCFPTA